MAVISNSRKTETRRWIYKSQSNTQQMSTTLERRCFDISKISVPYGPKTQKNSIPGRSLWLFLSRKVLRINRENRHFDTSEYYVKIWEEMITYHSLFLLEDHCKIFLLI